MPRNWTPKQERQYQHILESCSTRGGEQSECQRIAAATVNKQRAAKKKKRRSRTGGSSDCGCGE